MGEEEQIRRNNERVAPAVKADAPPERLVRHVFWKYPIISVVLLAATVGSPNYPRDTIAGATKDNPGGAVMAFTQELDGTASSSGNAQEFGMGDPGQVFVLSPLRAAIPLLGPISLPNLPALQASDVQQAITTYDTASPDQQMTWATNYDKALGTIAPSGGGAMGGGTPSPDYTKIGSLKGDFGPVPVLVEADLQRTPMPGQSAKGCMRGSLLLFPDAKELEGCDSYFNCTCAYSSSQGDAYP